MGGTISSSTYSLIENEFERVLEIKNRNTKIKKDYVVSINLRKDANSKRYSVSKLFN